MELPLLVTRGLVALPSVMIPLDVARPASVEAVRAAQQGQRRLVLAIERDDGCERVGTQAQLMQVTARPGGRLRVMVRTLSAVRIHAVDGGFAQVQSIPMGPEAEVPARRALADGMTRWVRSHPALDPSVERLFADPEVPSTLLCGLASQVGPFALDELQAWLALPVAERVAAMAGAMAERLEQMGQQPSVPPVPAPEDDLGPMPMELGDGVRWTARVHARTGLLDEAQIVSVTVDAWRGDWVAEHGHLQGLHEHVAATVADVLAEEARRRDGWAGQTDCDRLEEALDELGRGGVITGLYGTDLADALGHVQALDDADPRYVVFHQQDLLDAVNGRGLDLAFGGPDPLEVGRQAASALRARGLEVVWPERADVRLRVQMRWQRRPGGVRRAA